MPQRKQGIGVCSVMVISFPSTVLMIAFSTNITEVSRTNLENRATFPIPWQVWFWNRPGALVAQSYLLGYLGFVEQVVQAFEEGSRAVVQ